MIANTEFRAFESAFCRMANFMSADYLQSPGISIILENNGYVSHIESLDLAPSLGIRMPRYIQSRSGIRHVDGNASGPKVCLAVIADIREFGVIILYSKQSVTPGHRRGREPIRNTVSVVRYLWPCTRPWLLLR